VSESAPSTIAADSVVGIHYTLKNGAGDVIDSSSGDEPLVYLHGHENIVPGLERKLTGRTVGDKLAVVVQPGGSVGDEKVVERADELGIAMVFTGERHFLH